MPRDNFSLFFFFILSLLFLAERQQSCGFGAKYNVKVKVCFCDIRQLRLSAQLVSNNNNNDSQRRPNVHPVHGVRARLGRVKRSLLGQHSLLGPTGQPFSFSFLTQPDFKQLPPYCPDISRELVIIQTCLLGLNVQSGVIKPPSV